MIPTVPGHPTLWRPPPKLYRCEVCDVTWVSYEPICWVRGEKTPRRGGY